MSNLELNYRLTSSIDSINKNIESMDYNISQLQSGMGAITQDMVTVRKELAQLKRAFDNYVREAGRIAAVQRAETALGNLKAELERTYGHYAVVRRTCVGVLQAFDVGNVTNKVVSQVSEELMIQSPKYWLAPALVALAAWSRDDKEMCDKSTKEAYQRHPAKTSLFFALVLRRAKRNDIALQWLNSYFDTCNPQALSREFAVILEAAAQGSFGPTAEQKLAERLAEWNRGLRQQETVVRAQAQAWKGEITAHRCRMLTESYPNLPNLSPDFEQVKQLLESATALGNTVEKYTKISEATAPHSKVIEDVLDDLLEQLVTEYDEEETPLRRQVAYNEAIIESDGDLALADNRAQQYIRSLEETFDAVSLQTNAAINPHLLGVSTNTQRIAIGANLEDFRAGLKNYTEEYRSHYLPNITINLGQTHSGYAEQLRFIGFSSTTDTPETEALDGLRTAWDNTLISFIKSVKFKNSQAIKPILVGLAIFIVMMLLGKSAGIVGFLIGAGVAFMWTRALTTKAEQEVKKAEQIKGAAFEVSRNMLLEARAEFFDLQMEYQELDGQEANLQQLINTWPVSSSKELTA